MTDNPLRGQVGFPLFDQKPGFELIEPGTCLRYKMSDLIALKNLYKPDGRQFVIRYKQVVAGQEMETDATTYRQILMAALQQEDEEAILAALRHGLKTADGKTPFRLTADQMDDPPFRLGDAVPYIHNALFLAWFGKTPEEMAAETRAVLEAALDTAEAVTESPPGMSSDGSLTSPPGLGFSQTSSGTSQPERSFDTL